MEKKGFDILFISLKDKIFRFAKTILSDEAEAEDVTQDIFEKLWLNQEKLDEYTNIESYVFRSTKNLCLDRIRHRNVVLKNSNEIKYLSNNNVEPEPDKKDTSDIIKNTIKNLPEKQRIIIHLRDIEGYDFDEISKITGIEKNAIRVSLSRARKTVKQELIKIMSYGLQ